MLIIQKYSDEAYEDDYLHELIYSLEVNYAKRLVDTKSILNFTDTQFVHILRFADILSRSNNPLHRNRALYIISLLIEFCEYKENSYLNAIATSILIKLGNFPSLPIINSSEQFLKLNEIKIEYIYKSIYNKSPLGNIFTDSQFEVFKEIQKHDYYSFSGSTSFGKSYIFESFIKSIINKENEKNIVFLVPTKALINQVSNKIRQIVKDNNYKVINSPQIPKILLNENSKYIFVFTAERLTTYFSDKCNPKIDYLFVDEAHKLLNDTDIRTPSLYHAISSAKDKQIKIYFASPNVVNSDIFLKLFNVDDINSISIKESPVCQNRFYINTAIQKAYMLSDLGEDIQYNNLIFTKNKMDNLYYLLEKFSKNRQSIIYCNTIKHTIDTAKEISKKYEDIDNDELKKLIKIIKEKVHEQYFLVQCLKKGIAYHIGNMPEEIKLSIEKLFKKGVIKYIFCTSTLLEGVNLPAKNIFILSEAIGQKRMDSIDFWNLAGRAGRLCKDISGNIFCVNIYDQDNYWQDETRVKILRNKKIEKKEPQLIKKNNKNFYTNIYNHLSEKDYTNKNLSEVQKKTISMYSNILVYQNLMNSGTLLKEKYIQNNDINILEKVSYENKVPVEILSKSIDVDLKIQNSIIESNLEMLPIETRYQNCLEMLSILSNKFDWKNTESKGQNPMFNKDTDLRYYAILLYSWINGKPLNYVIKNTLRYYDNKYLPKSYNRKNKYKEKFDKNNIEHINFIINNIVKDMENIIKFKVKNYVSIYQAILSYKEIEFPLNWGDMIDYGTTDTNIIAIQNLGFSRNIALFLKEEHLNLFKRNNDNMIIDINLEELKTLSELDKEKYPLEIEELNDFFESI